jgi:hypothetical protein
MKLKEQEIHTPAIAQSSRCCHYWIIDYSEESNSQGHCKLCGEQRDFHNRVAISPKEAGHTLEPED